MAEDVLPVSAMTSSTRAGVQAEALADRGDDARVGLVGHDEVDLLQRRRRRARRRASADSDMAVDGALERRVPVHRDDSADRADDVLRRAAVAAQDERPDDGRLRRRR